jgi:hypothetical protein
MRQELVQLARDVVSRTRIGVTVRVYSIGFKVCTLVAFVTTITVRIIIIDTSPTYL